MSGAPSRRDSAGRAGASRTRRIVVLLLVTTTVAVVGLVSTLADEGALRRSVVVMCAASLAASAGLGGWMLSRSGDRTLVADELLRHPHHGRLESVRDSERRGLRSIGCTAYEAASRTGVLLADVTTAPGVRLFFGLRVPGSDLPSVPHAIQVGREVLLVESVAWPSGCYQVSGDGRLYCNATYTGQSIQPLLVVARRWRDALPRGYRVTAVVVVHPTGTGQLTLPCMKPTDALWLPAEHAADEIRGRVRGARRPASRVAIAALIAGTREPA
jgi:hypothetical protein